MGSLTLAMHFKFCRCTQTPSILEHSECFKNMGAYQNAPTVAAAVCATRMGIEPYRPNLEFVSYSKTSRLNKRKGSNEMLFPVNKASRVINIC